MVPRTCLLNEWKSGVFQKKWSGCWGPNREEHPDSVLPDLEVVGKGGTEKPMVA